MASALAKAARDAMSDGPAAPNPAALAAAPAAPAVPAPAAPQPPPPLPVAAPPPAAAAPPGPAIGEQVMELCKSQLVQYALLFVSVVIVLYILQPPFVHAPVPPSQHDNPTYHPGCSAKAVVVVATLTVVMAAAAPVVSRNWGAINGAGQWAGRQFGRLTGQ